MSLILKSVLSDGWKMKIWWRINIKTYFIKLELDFIPDTMVIHIGVKD